MSAELQTEVVDPVAQLERVVKLYLADTQASHAGAHTAVDKFLEASAHPFSNRKAESVFTGFTDQGRLFLAAKALDAAEVFVATADLSDGKFTEWQMGELITTHPGWPRPLSLMDPTGQEELGLGLVQGAAGWELTDRTGENFWLLRPLDVLIAAAARLRATGTILE